jgi:RHS repeat-associated protein
LAPIGFTFAFDAENRLAVGCPNDPTPSNCVNTAANGRTLYGYDGDGKRVTKQTPDGTVTTFVYDAMGDLAAEYSSTPVTPAVAGTIYLTTDHLGSTRVVTDSSATPVAVARHDYRPFGEEISFNATNPRHGVQGYAQDAGVRQQFTGQEREGETGLDNFISRYFSGAQGRFTSPDAPFNDQSRADPQSWNLFSYVRNNPLKYIDPTGEDCVYTNDYSSTGQIGYERGDCSQDGGRFINGTIDENSFKVRNGALEFGYTDPNGAVSVHSIGLPSALTYGDMFINAMASRRQASNQFIAGFVAADVIFATAFASTYAGPALLSAAVGGGEAGVLYFGPFTREVARFAQKYNINGSSETGREVLFNLDMTVDKFISTFRQAGVRGVFPSQYLRMSVPEAISSGDSTVRKLLTDARFAK